MTRLPGSHYPVLVPNQKGLDNLLSLLSSHPSSSPSTPPPTDEIAVFTAATDAFAKANTNCTVSESLDRLAPVVSTALQRGLRVRGYVSVVIVCPYTGRVRYEDVKSVTRALREMGCYEVSLGDTVGMGTPASVGEMLEVVTGGSDGVPVEVLAVSPLPFTSSSSTPSLTCKQYSGPFPRHVRHGYRQRLHRPLPRHPHNRRRSRRPRRVSLLPRSHRQRRNRRRTIRAQRQ